MRASYGVATADAPVVFAAADRGSTLAARVIDAGAEHLALLVDQVRGRGATGDVVVAAGSVIVRQPRLRDAFAARLRLRHPELSFRVLTDAPVAGAVMLARRLRDGNPGPANAVL